MNPGSNGRFVKYDYRCPSCGRKWFRAYIGHGTVLDIRCPRCNLFYVVGKDDDGMFIRKDEIVTKREPLDIS